MAMMRINAHLDGKLKNSMVWVVSVE
jgi:hypothetical protein